MKSRSESETTQVETTTCDTADACDGPQAPTSVASVDADCSKELLAKSFLVPAFSFVKPIVEHPAPFTGDVPISLLPRFNVRLGGEFSFMCTLVMHGMEHWSRVFGPADFSLTADEDSITAGAVDLTNDLHFTVFRGKRPFSVRVVDFFVLDQECTLLCTVSASGHMKVFKDGVLVGENVKGMAPLHLDRPHMIVGGHYLFHDQVFRGTLKGMKVWIQDVSWSLEPFSPANSSHITLNRHVPDWYINWYPGYSMDVIRHWYSKVMERFGMDPTLPREGQMTKVSIWFSTALRHSPYWKDGFSRHFEKISTFDPYDGWVVVDDLLTNWTENDQWKGYREMHEVLIKGRPHTSYVYWVLLNCCEMIDHHGMQKGRLQMKCVERAGAADQAVPWEALCAVLGRRGPRRRCRRAASERRGAPLAAPWAVRAARVHLSSLRPRSTAAAGLEAPRVPPCAPPRRGGAAAPTFTFRLTDILSFDAWFPTTAVRSMQALAAVTLWRTAEFTITTWPATLQRLDAVASRLVGLPRLAAGQWSPPFWRIGTAVVQRLAAASRDRPMEAPARALPIYRQAAEVAKRAVRLSVTAGTRPHPQRVFVKFLQAAAHPDTFDTTLRKRLATWIEHERIPHDLQQRWRQLQVFLVTLPPAWRWIVMRSATTCNAVMPFTGCLALDSSSMVIFCIVSGPPEMRPVAQPRAAAARPPPLAARRAAPSAQLAAAPAAGGQRAAARRAEAAEGGARRRMKRPAAAAPAPEPPRKSPRVKPMRRPAGRRARGEEEPEEADEAAGLSADEEGFCRAPSAAGQDTPATARGSPQAAVEPQEDGEAEDASDEGAELETPERLRNPAALQSLEDGFVRLPEEPGSKHGCELKVNHSTGCLMSCDIRIPPESGNAPEIMWAGKTLLLHVHTAPPKQLIILLDGNRTALEQGDICMVRAGQEWSVSNGSKRVCASIKMVLRSRADDAATVA
ncbi:unnamed protein product [Prorocentrum cordatum]|uniref:Uncharacterized protein n=1 Tax=Prorocentrum cordatum TaxID=2364126 RepID=A0ABN9SLD4_9DINO|nr:unnamed protein product [Polarella glacialis]